jgi:hypothetical protein
MQTAIELQQADSRTLHALLTPIRLVINAIEASLMFIFFFLVLLTVPVYLFITGQPISPVLAAGWQMAICSIPLIMISPRTSTLMFCTIFGAMVGPECMLGIGALMMAVVSLLTAIRHTYKFTPCLLSVLWWALVAAFLLTGHTLFPGHPPEYTYSSSVAAMVLGNCLCAAGIKHHAKTLMEEAYVTKLEVDNISENMRQGLVERKFEAADDAYQSLNQKRVGLLANAVKRAEASYKFGNNPFWLDDFRRALMVARGLAQLS